MADCESTNDFGKAAFPIVYQEKRGWSPGQGGLAFLGVTVGMLCTVPYNIWANKKYAKLSDQHDGFAPPEARLPLCMAGAVAAPIGLFWVRRRPSRQRNSCTDSPSSPGQIPLPSTGSSASSPVHPSASPFASSFKASATTSSTPTQSSPPLCSPVLPSSALSWRLLFLSSPARCT